MLRRTYDRLMQLAASPAAPLWLAGVAFIEGVCFPIPPDVMLMPMVLARREHAWRNATICFVASVAGGSTGYALGYFLQPVGRWLIALTGHTGDDAHFRAWYAQWGVFLLAVPIPYKLTAIASGLFQLPYALFLSASIGIRGLRFFLVAWLVRTYGEPIRAFVETRLALVVSGVALLVIGLFAALRFVG